MSKRNADAIHHERELREMADRTVQHERELRLQTEAAVEKVRDIQLRELERRLNNMNQFREQLESQAATFMTLERFEREHAALEESVAVRIDSLVSKGAEDHELLLKMLTQVGAFRGIILFLGLPGIVALVWAVLAAFSNRPLTGPGGFLP